MKFRRSLLGLALLAAALAAAADEPTGAPLEGSKRELKALQADQAAKNSANGKLTEGLPQVSAPTPGEVPLDLSSSIRTEKELNKKKDAQKNWLLDGMDKLGQNKNAKKEGKGKDDKDAGTEEDKPDPADSDYLLKLYSEQKKNDEAKAEARKTGALQNDPFAPFLQGWLAGSPSPGKPADGFGRKPEAGVGIVGVPGSGEFNQPQAAGLAGEVGSYTRTEPAPVQPNPYLQLSEIASSADSAAASNATGVPTVVTGPAVAAPAAAMADPIPASRPEEKKPQFLRPSDNDKYFPQQKKF